MQRYGEPVRYLHQENAGPAGARNLALQHAAGRYVAFLDADDVWHPHKLAVQVPLMESNPQSASAGAHEGVPQRRAIWPGRTRRRRRLDAGGRTPRAREEPLQHLDRGRAHGGGAQAGGFDPDIFGPEDWDLWRRITQRWPGMSMRAVLAGYRERDESVSSNARRMLENNRKVLRKAFADNPGLPLRLSAEGAQLPAPRRDAGVPWAARPRAAPITCCELCALSAAARPGLLRAADQGETGRAVCRSRCWACGAGTER